MITAFVLVHTEAPAIVTAAQAIADVEGVAEVYSCAGDVDLIAKVVVDDHEKVADVVTRHISQVPGVVRTVTHLAFRSYARRDLDSAFDLGT